MVFFLSRVGALQHCGCQQSSDQVLSHDNKEAEWHASHGQAMQNAPSDSSAYHLTHMHTPVLSLLGIGLSLTQSTTPGLDLLLSISHSPAWNSGAELRLQAQMQATLAPSASQRIKHVMFMWQSLTVSAAASRVTVS